jgi:very-short-patch-repair endonuclease
MSPKIIWGLRRTPPQVWTNIRPLAQQKRHNPTEAEQKLWLRLRNRQVAQAKFRRQHAIERFIVDFFCPDYALVIEVDGPIHNYTVEEDQIRQEFLESLGLHVIRFTNAEVLEHIGDVLVAIRNALVEQTTSP